jgi:ADP-ribosylglycohydrolase
MMSAVEQIGQTKLASKIRGCLYGGAIGDAIGAPAEGKSPEAIRERYGEINGFAEPWDGPSEIGKGDGRYTDDTLMTQTLARLYIETGDTLNVFRFAKGIVPLITDEARWVPERGREMPLVERLFYAEKWLLLRLRHANVDPRTGGIGNMVNCGAAMYAAPVGIVHAGDPTAAYREAVEIFGAHQTSYGLEAAGVMAACVAEAFKPGASVDSVVGTALAISNEGTHRAIAAVVEVARGSTDWRGAITPLRDAMRPFDGAAENIRDRGNGTNTWNPSRMHSIEEVPIALAMLIVTGGDFRQSVLAGANYGRDCDSIAGMAGAISGALHGERVIPEGWAEQIDAANRFDFRPLVDGLATLAVSVQRRDSERARARAATLSALLD